jgi:hypothetical protein
MTVAAATHGVGHVTVIEAHDNVKRERLVPSDIGLSRSGVPWFTRRDAFTRGLDDQPAYRNAYGGDRVVVDRRS